MRATICFAGLAAIFWPQFVTGQAIQLPSFHSFSVDTTVVVPDAGRTKIAGNARGRTSASRLQANRAVGLDRQASGAAALATIHDPQQADAALRRQAQARSRAAAEGSVPTPAPWPDSAAATDRAVPSVTAAQAQREMRSAAIERETWELIRKARAAAAGGKPGVATIYYQRAAAQATGRLRHTIAAEKDRLNRPPAVARAASDERSTAKGNSPAGAQR